MNQSGKINSLLVILLVALISGIYGTRLFGFEKDYLIYLSIYEQIKDFGELLFTQYEPGFLLINAFAAFAGLSFTLFSSFTIALSIGLKTYLFSKGRFLYIPLLIYVIWLSWLHEGTQIRVALAIALFNLSIYFLVLNDRKKSIFFLLLAASMHISTILFIPVYISGYFSKKKKISNAFMFVSSLICLIMVVLSLNLVGMWHPNYEGYSEMGTEFSLFSLKMYPMYLLLWLCKPNISSSFERQMLFYICLYSIFMAIGFYNLGSVPGRVMEFSFISYLLMANDKNMGQKKSLLIQIGILLFSIVNSVKLLYFEGGYFT